MARAPGPIAGPCCGLLTWRASGCCNHGQRPEVRAKCKGLLQRAALPQARPLTARGRWGEGERGKRASEEPPLLGQRLPGWLAGYRELQRSLNELALLAWPGGVLS